MYTIIAKDKVLIYWFVPDIMYIYKNENSMEIILTSNKKQHKHQNDSYISFPYYLHLFLNCVIFNSQPNNVGAQKNRLNEMVLLSSQNTNYKLTDRNYHNYLNMNKVIFRKNSLMNMGAHTIWLI